MSKTPLATEQWEHRFLDGPDTSWHPGRLTNLDMSVKLVYEERRVTPSEPAKEPNLLTGKHERPFLEIVKIDPAAAALRAQLEQGLNAAQLLKSAVEYYYPLVSSLQGEVAALKEEHKKFLEGLIILLEGSECDFARVAYDRITTALSGGTQTTKE